DFNKKLELQVEQRTKQLKIAKQQVEVANQAKSDFLATISHEIRIPINAIKGQLYLLDKSDLPDLQASYVKTAKQSSEELLQLVTTMLDFSLLESGKIVAQRVSFDARELLNTIIEPLKLDAEDKQLALLSDLQQLENLQLIGDELRLGQIVTELISNAIEYTSQGAIRVSASIETLNVSDAILTIKVQDNGIGISDELKACLFELFHQEDSSSTREYGGCGVGLALCKQLCDLLSAKISVVS
ncbi:MAG: histidine kinase, partial [Psychromonas sp.]|nr:histidine kinase [Psychromonas sp.]